MAVELQRGPDARHHRRALRPGCGNLRAAGHPVCAAALRAARRDAKLGHARRAGPHVRLVQIRLGDDGGGPEGKASVAVRLVSAFATGAHVAAGPCRRRRDGAHPAGDDHDGGVCGHCRRACVSASSCADALGRTCRARLRRTAALRGCAHRGWARLQHHTRRVRSLARVLRCCMLALAHALPLPLATAL